MSISKMATSRFDRYFNDNRFQSNLKHRSLRGAGITVFSQGVVFGIQMIGTIILARLLTPDDFGLVAMVAAFSFLFQNLGLRGFSEATIQSDDIDHSKISALFWLHVVLSIFVSLLFMSLGPFFVWFYRAPELLPITIVIALSFVFNAFCTQHLALLARNLEYYRITLNEITATLIATLVAVALARHGGDYWALVARRVVPLISTAAGAWILCRWVPGSPTRLSHIKDLLKFALNTYGNFAVNYTSRNLDKVLIGWRYGPQPLGHYERAYYLFVMPANQISYPLTNIAVATLSRLRDNPERYLKYYLKSISTISLIGMPLSTVLTLAGNDLILLLLGEQWSRAGDIFTAFGPAIGVLLVYGTHGWIHLSLGKADRWFRWGIAELAITAICFAIGLSFGAIGVALAYTSSIYILIFPGLLYAGKPIRMGPRALVSAVWKYYLSALLSGILGWFILYSYDVSSSFILSADILVRILLTTIICLSTYIAFIIIFFQGIKPFQELSLMLRDMLSKEAPIRKDS